MYCIIGCDVVSSYNININSFSLNLNWSPFYLKLPQHLGFIITYLAYSWWRQSKLLLFSQYFFFLIWLIVLWTYWRYYKYGVTHDITGTSCVSNTTRASKLAWCNHKSTSCWFNLIKIRKKQEWIVSKVLKKRKGEIVVTVLAWVTLLVQWL